jgi:acid phosphatase class B
MVLKNARAKVEHYWTNTKKMLAAMSVWGLIFSLVTITHLGVAFDYDDTLVHSDAAFSKAIATGQQLYSEGFWTVVNQNYDLETPKYIPFVLAWAFRIFGFHIAVLTTRPAIGADPLKKEWRHLVSKGYFIFASDKTAKHSFLQNGNYVLYFGDSDSDIEEARQAHVFPVRVRRDRHSTFKEDYNPGSMHELVIPFSEY